MHTYTTYIIQSTTTLTVSIIELTIQSYFHCQLYPAFNIHRASLNKQLTGWVPVHRLLLDWSVNCSVEVGMCQYALYGKLLAEYNTKPPTTPLQLVASVTKPYNRHAWLIGQFWQAAVQ